MTAITKKPNINVQPRIVRLGTLAAGAVLLSACAVQPKPMTLEQQQELIDADRPFLFVEQEPIIDGITLEEALARALKYNLDSRLMLMEGVLRDSQLHLSRFDMLPALAVNAGYTTRSNDNLNSSKDLVTGVVSNNPSLSQDRNLGYANLALTWNILDFGVSYFQAHQNADQYLIAQERKRRVVNQIVQQVRASYWRAATAEPLYEQILPLLVQARQALTDARSVEEQRLQPPLDVLQYQKGLVEVVRELEAMELDLAIAKTELSSLMGLPPGSQFTLVLPPQEEMVPPELRLGIEEMEEIALLNRPELIEEAYQKRISALETRKAFLRLFPGLTLTSSINEDTNSYLINQNWADVGARLTWNLLNLASGSSALRAAGASEDVAEVRRLALSLAALTQVHVSYQQYRRARVDYEQALILDDIEQRIYGYVSQGADSQSQSPLQLIRAQMAAIYAEVSSYRAYAEVHSAIANLYVSIGLDLLPESVESHDIEAMSATIKTVLDDWSNGNLSSYQRVGGAVQ